MSYESEPLFPEPPRTSVPLIDFDVRDLEARLARDEQARLVFERAHQRIASAQGRVALFNLHQDGSMHIPEEEY